MILLYWQIGQEILVRQQAEGWGTKVITQLSKDLKQEFPEMTGFSARNLGYVKSFAEAWSDETILHQLGAKIPWKHNCRLIEKVKDPLKRCWYAQETISHGWSRSVLTAQIETQLYEREGSPSTNFDTTLPPAQSDLANQVLKDPYHLDFLTLSKDIKFIIAPFTGLAQRPPQADLAAVEAHLLHPTIDLRGRKRLPMYQPLLRAARHRDARQYGDILSCTLVGLVGTHQSLPLMPHPKVSIMTHCITGMHSFRPEYSGRMNLFISAVDEQMRKDYDRPTIGIILCKTKNKTIAEYAIRNLRNPIAVATHQLPQDLQDELPATEQLQAEFENALQLAEGQDESTE